MFKKPDQFVSIREYFEALRSADQHAIQIKEEADERALELARTIQTYKDEKANELRSQIERERGSYATKDDLNALEEKRDIAVKALGDKFDIAHQPVVEFMASQQGGKSQTVWYVGIILALVTIIVAALAIVAVLLVKSHG